MEHDKDKMAEKDAKLVGRSNDTLPPDCRQAIGAVDSKLNARQLTQAFTCNDGEKAYLPMPNICRELAPHEINCYGGGSLLHAKGGCWKIGGAVVWWPGRVDQPNVEEKPT